MRAGVRLLVCAIVLQFLLPADIISPGLARTGPGLVRLKVALVRTGPELDKFSPVLVKTCKDLREYFCQYVHTMKDLSLFFALLSLKLSIR